MQILIAATGLIRCLYDEAVDLAKLGRLEISRGSQVEPTRAGQWTADLSPVGGPRLGPFPCRSDALAAERRWLEEHWLIPAADPVQTSRNEFVTGPAEKSARADFSSASEFCDPSVL